MPQLSFQLSEGHTSAYELGRKISRESLYGKSSLLVTDTNGQALDKGIVLPTGDVLPNSSVSRVRCDSQGSLTEPEETRQDGQVLAIQLSSFKEAKGCQLVPPAFLAEFAVSDVYPLDLADESSPLAPGHYLSEFNYRDSATPSECVLVVPAKGQAFLLIGEKREFAFLAKDTTYDLFDSTDDSLDDSDGGFDFDF
jgi:hypothetical protein